MFASRLLHPEAVGEVTEGGNLIGEFTVDGTIALILFGGLGSGLIAGAVWVFIKRWIAESYWLVGWFGCGVDRWVCPCRSRQS